MHRCLNCGSVLGKYSDICSRCGAVYFDTRDEPREASTRGESTQEKPMLPANAPERSGERLSVVQKQILLMAYANRLREERTAESRGADLYYQQVLEEVYGFPPAVGGEHCPGSRRFDRQAIGPPRYNAAVAAVSRSMSRLHKRGLILCLCGSHNRWSGCSITPKGERLIFEWTKERSG